MSVIQVECLLVSICIVRNTSYYTHVCQYVAVELHHLFYLVTERHTRQASNHFLFSTYCKMLLDTFSLLKSLRVHVNPFFLLSFKKTCLLFLCEYVRECICVHARAHICCDGVFHLSVSYFLLFLLPCHVCGCL